jgi:hypothetical protein
MIESSLSAWGRMNGSCENDNGFQFHKVGRFYWIDERLLLSQYEILSNGVRY